MTVALCDPEVFYPLRSLVAGPFDDLRELIGIKRFMQTVVLHEEMKNSIGEPRAYNPEEDEEEPTEEELRDGGRMVIVAFGPDLRGYEFFSERTEPQNLLPIELTSNLRSIAEEFFQRRRRECLLHGPRTLFAKHYW